MRRLGLMVVALALGACGDDGGEGTTAEASTGGSSPTSTTSPTPTVPGSTTDPMGSDTSGGDSSGAPPVSECSPDEQLLIDLVNEYRGENGLPPIPASPSMCIVGHTHAEDLQLNAPHEQAGGDCNLHSWSDAGPWSACCYTPDHAAAQCMWDKPRELTVYPGNGYENAAGGGSGPITPEQALELWKQSAGHNAVILNEGQWSDNPWQALGAGVYEGYAVLWFGEEADPAG